MNEDIIDQFDEDKRFGKASLFIQYFPQPITVIKYLSKHRIISLTVLLYILYMGSLLALHISGYAWYQAIKFVNIGVVLTAFVEYNLKFIIPVLLSSLIANYFFKGKGTMIDSLQIHLWSNYALVPFYIAYVLLGILIGHTFQDNFYTQEIDTYVKYIQIAIGYSYYFIVGTAGFRFAYKIQYWQAFICIFVPFCANIAYLFKDSFM